MFVVPGLRICYVHLTVKKKNIRYHGNVNLFEFTPYYCTLPLHFGTTAGQKIRAIKQGKQTALLKISATKTYQCEWYLQRYLKQFHFFHKVLCLEERGMREATIGNFEGLFWDVGKSNYSKNPLLCSQMDFPVVTYGSADLVKTLVETVSALASCSLHSPNSTFPCVLCGAAKPETSGKVHF